MMTRQEILFGLISAIFKCGLKTKVIIYKSRGETFLWNRIWDLGWLYWACWQYWKILKLRYAKYEGSYVFMDKTN